MKRSFFASRINWKEVFKFLSGALFMGSIANGYLYANQISVPFLGFYIPSELLGLRALVQFVLFLVFFYYGFLKK